MTLPKGTQLHAHFNGVEWEGMLVTDLKTFDGKHNLLHMLIKNLCQRYHKYRKFRLKSGATGDMI